MDIEKKMQEAHLIIDEDLASDKQVGGSHYKLKIEPIDFITANEIPFCLANVVKYICRKKGNRSKQIEDLRKAIHYLELHLEKVYKVDPQGEDLKE